ncbi:hypothetical protein, partial [Amycolatopsis sp. NPDC102389]|uniref:hypothetical protein n=1 Tax=Amycolatopsis sp. NPDC102389 TaxID=3363941 RepID=UPI0038185872
NTTPQKLTSSSTAPFSTSSATYAPAYTPPLSTTPVTDSDQATPQEQEVDAKVAAAGLTVTDYPSAHLFVKAACDTFPGLSNATDGGVDPSEWLDGNATRDTNGARVHQIGIPILCPTFAKDIDAALKGLATKSDGTYEVGQGPGKIAPGKWKAVRAANDCYWERTSATGDIIDNKFVTHATTMIINVRRTDGSVTFQGCPKMQFVK